MDITGPIKTTIGDAADGVSKVVVITFQPDFKAMQPVDQDREFAGYLASLRSDIAAIPDEADRSRAGMMIMLQFCEQLAPHISNGDLDLDEQIVLQIQREDSAGGALVDFISKSVN